MSTGKSGAKSKRFLDEHPECVRAFRYLLKCPEKCAVLMELCSRFKISNSTWMRCYARFGPRNGIGWIESIKREKISSDRSRPGSA